jgi:hypothetical protein
VLIDIEAGRVVDVLPDRTAETFTAWLQEHPGAEIVCRDRASAYAEAVRTAAPEAVQIADRFHLWLNLCKTVEKCVVVHRRCLTPPEEAQDTVTVPPQPPAVEGKRAANNRRNFAAVMTLLESPHPSLGYGTVLLIQIPHTLRVRTRASVSVRAART